MTRTAEHRPARRRRRFRHDDYVACDLFAGFGGLTLGIEMAGFTTIVAANHNAYKVEVHEANYPHADHWIADLVDRESPNYHSVRDLPAADFLVAGVSCFAAGTLILTRRGLTPIEQVRTGDEVWTHRSRWRTVTSTSAVKRPTVTVNATTAITCTPDHPFWAAPAQRTRQPRRKYQPLAGARCLECGGPAPRFRATSTARLFCSGKCRQLDTSRRALPVPGTPRQVRADSLQGMWVGTPILGHDGAALPAIDGLGVITPGISWMLGRWAAAGQVAREPEHDGAWSSVTIRAGHAESDDLARHLARLTGLPWNRTRQHAADTFGVSRHGLAAFIAGNFGHSEAGKRVPAWMLFAPEDIRQAFADGYVSADGRASRAGRRLAVMPASKELAVGMRLLLTSLGYYTTVHYGRPVRRAAAERRETRQQPRWTVTAHKSRDRRAAHRDAGGQRWGKANGAVTAGETMTVYNMTVDEDHTYIGDGVVVHNCVNHSQANSVKAYRQGLTLFDLDDPEYEARVTRSERDRATANCFPAGTIVVARRGMVPIEELEPGEEVLTHRNRWRRITASVSRRSRVVTVKGRGHTALEVTANHKFLTRSAALTRRGWTFSDDEDWTPAAGLIGHAWQSPAEFPAADIPHPPDGWSYSRHFWRTAGRWLGDGQLRHCTPAGGHAGPAELDGPPNARVSENPATISCELRGSGPLARWLMEHFGELAQDKTIPAWALSMDTEYREALVEGYLSAGGAAGLDGRRGRCVTVSRRLAIGLKLLLQSLGYRPALRCRKPQRRTIEGRSGVTRPMWILQWTAGQRRASTIATIGGRCVGVVREVIDEEREADVFDIEVDEDHSFIADGLIVHNCVLHYAQRHHPRLILVECTTQIASWGPALPGRKIGDGSTYRWWLKQFTNEGYRYRVLYLNSMFFGVPQSRDRWFCAFWDRRLPAPDLEHRPPSWCSCCEQVVEAVWTWRTGIPPTGKVCYGQQYNYRCPRCRTEVIPPVTPSLHALDLTNLGTRIGDRDTPPAASSLARAERCRQRMAEFPPVLMPAAAVQGPDGHPWQPMATPEGGDEPAAAPGAVAGAGAVIAAAGNTYERPGSTCRSRGFDQPLWAQTATNTMGLLTAPVAVAVDNYQGAPRGADQPLPTQGGSETLGLLSARILPNRTNGTSRSLGEPMETLVAGAGSGGLGVLSTGVAPYPKGTVPVTHDELRPGAAASQLPALLTAAGIIKNNGTISEAKYRAHPLSDPLGTVVGSAITQGLLFSGWYKQNGSTGSETAPHPLSDPFGTFTGRDTTALLFAEWRAIIEKLPLDDYYYRMMGPHEVGRGCGYDVDFPGHKGTFQVWGSARAQVDGFGNAVSPQVGAWIGSRLLPSLNTPEGAA